METSTRYPCRAAVVQVQSYCVIEDSRRSAGQVGFIVAISLIGLAALILLIGWIYGAYTRYKKKRQTQSGWKPLGDLEMLLR